MIDGHMVLDSIYDAHQWSYQFGLECGAQEARLAMWLWLNKPFLGCSYTDMMVRFPGILDSEDDREFWMIVGDC